ncbi:MAG TPA: bifunctional UDP-N-acetylglucosamine diphosphorylase/glucosamine-1-phosphate N-acetyltransferase GlmU [Polyangiaceae bacterium]|jgi:bifunctional UDP-N-acetylglucosamine pyrophosphorylase/glucosamine-1-phosphate N-acetyltransferase|nr:bifunctional UDP-N-acetylglucosamine diphosphorylase/glucosamine-1-phosphate N-acetyltransferase GlmU [Polyangiaceae bacterium]
MQTTTAILLAAGQGTRMKSAIPKVMHRVCGLPILHFGVQAALDAGCGEVIVVVGHGRQLVEEYLARAFSSDRVRTVVQESQRGTGDAARAGLSVVGGDMVRALILNGDVPLVRGEDLRTVAHPLDDANAPAALAIATCVVDDATGYGRILRETTSQPPQSSASVWVKPAAGRVTEIREHRDLKSDRERAIREVNAGVYAANVALLREAVAALVPNNVQSELYLTDIVAFASNAGERVATVELAADVLAGVNDREQLASVEEMLHRRLVRIWRTAGATVRDGARIEAGVTLAPDAVVETGAVLRGTTRVGRGATIDVGCVLTNVVVGEGAIVRPYSVATDSRIGARAEVGPFSHLRPESDLGEEAHVGNFVETKKTKMGRGAKANHLSYLGDGIIGERANIGAGTIFCNYDGAGKHTTTIESGVFIGSDSQLVAPVTVGRDAYVATGTTVTRDVPAEALAIGRAPQQNKEGYAPRLRARFQAARDARAEAKKTR